MHYPTTSPNSNSSMRLQDDPEGAFERPPPKSNAELYNPKGGRRQPVGSPPAGGNTSGFSTDQANGKCSLGGPGAEVDAMAEHVGGLNIGQQVEGSQSTFVMPPPAATAGALSNES